MSVMSNQQTFQIHHNNLMSVIGNIYKNYAIVILIFGEANLFLKQFHPSILIQVFTSKQLLIIISYSF